MHTAIFVCLANSRKHKGRCLAGKALYNGSFTKWIRPITTHPSEELQASEHRLQTGQDAAILDLINITLIEPKGKLHQQENWLMDVSVPLKKMGTMTVEEVSQVIDSPPNLWGVGFSSKNAINDFVPASEIQQFDCSLFLVEVDNLIVHIVEETYPYFRKVMAGTFSYKGSTYKLKITDPVFENDFGAHPVGDYEMEKTLLTISLGENFKDNFYKLIAGIIPITNGKKWSS